MSIFRIKNHKWVWRAAFILPFFLFVLLSWKNPYAGRSLIGNFDPFPDTIHYVVPARNFVLGHGFRVSRPEGEVPMAVPPLYSLTLIPGYFLNHDPRTYYFVNLVLGIVSLYFLYRIAKQLTQSPFVTGLILTLYAGTYVIFWQVSLAMAENVLLPVLFASLWLWLQPVSLKNTLIGSALAVGCYGSKYVSLPLTLVLLLFILIRNWLKLPKRQVVKSTVAMVVVTTLCMTMMNGAQLVEVVTNVFRAQHVPTAAAATSWLSPQFMSKSFPQYFGALIGRPIYNLWSVRPILPLFLACIVILWCAYAAVRLPKYRSLSLLLIFLIFAQLTFLSMISMIEGRYAFVFLPLTYTGVAAMAGWLLSSLKQVSPKKLYWGQLVIVTVVVLLFAVNSWKDWKLQLLLNFKGGEVPWWQVGIVDTDKWLNQVSPNTSDQPAVISSMPPFLWDFYRKGEYQMLPYTNDQIFAGRSIWGIHPLPSDWTHYYRNEINRGRLLYISTVGFNQAQWEVLETYRQNFSLKLVSEYCDGACKLYQLRTR